MTCRAAATCRGFRLARLGIGPEDARKSRLVAGSAIARLDSKTTAALGFSEGAKSIERQLTGAEAGAFLIARDVSGDPGFAAKRDGSMALRRDLGPIGVTLSRRNRQRVAGDQDQRDRFALSLDQRLASTATSAKPGCRRASAGSMRPRRCSADGMGGALGGGGSTSLFLDLEARRDLGNGWAASLAGTARLDRICRRQIPDRGL